MEEGRKQLAASAGFRRLITVALHRGQQYDSMDGVQAELSARVMELAPAGMPPQQQVPKLWQWLSLVSVVTLAAPKVEEPWKEPRLESVTPFSSRELNGQKNSFPCLRQSGG